MALFGRSVIIEGISGCGKSALIDRIYSEMGNNCTVINNKCKVYEATESARINLCENGFPLIPEALLHTYTNWMKLYEQREIHSLVLIDRFTMSNLVYFLSRCEIENVPVNIDLARDFFLKPFGIEVLSNTCTLYLDCLPSKAQERVISRCHRSKFDYQLQEKAREIYHREINIYPNPLHVIDASSTHEYTYQQARSILESIIAG